MTVVKTWVRSRPHPGRPRDLHALETMQRTATTLCAVYANLASDFPEDVKSWPNRLSGLLADLS